MAQLFCALFFSLVAIGAMALVCGMLRQEWARVVAILGGRELQHARAAAPEVRVRVRSWLRPELRYAVRPLRAAA